VSWRHAIALNITAQASNGMTGAYNVDVTSRPDGTSVMALEPAGACEGKGCQAMSYFAECPSCGVDLSGTALHCHVLYRGGRERIVASVDENPLVKT
jgi:hypothetical protein